MPEATPFTIAWVQGLTCNGNSHSLLNYTQFASFCEVFSFLYHPLFPSPFTLKALMDSPAAIDVLIIEGALSHDASMIERHGMGLDEILGVLMPRATHVVCVGSCASFGGVFKERDPEKIMGGLFRGEKKGGFFGDALKTLAGNSLVNLPGCPVHPSWVIETLMLLKHRRPLVLDTLCRPKEIYAYLAHHGCLRNEYFEWKVDCDTFGIKEGCLFYEQGCQGPMTHANCNKILWNETSSKTRVGSPCLGCTEPSFPRQTLFLTPKYMSLPAVPVGISRRAYYALAGVAKGFRIERLEKRLMDED
ncbi:hydrogenase [Sulfurospirillum sp. T05]|uniref:Hydrogenase n=1 Tax=Sulfurospirillum tamanense TaxID=2813362 RepID=A0ABS2WR72_9BACT|nr:hydrogenase [Sulfurospirillum tamanensis]MBN2964166.1 hydrogenase [Sulfurospirillum tamanensis]